MALFNDGPINRTDELLQFDSSAMDTAALEGVDTGAQIANAQTAIGVEILTFLLDNEPADPLFGSATGGRRRRLGTSDVVVTAELKRWHAFQTLHGIYRDALGHQSNDRYEWKFEEFGKLTRDAKWRCLGIGIGLAADPMARAAAPQITMVAGGGSAGSLYFAAAFVNASGQEGAASSATEATVQEGMQARVTVNCVPENARGWNVYAGISPTSLMRQNSTALDIGAGWLQPALIVAGDAPGEGQRPSFHAVQNQIVRRG